MLGGQWSVGRADRLMDTAWSFFTGRGKPRSLRQRVDDWQLTIAGPLSTRRWLTGGRVHFTNRRCSICQKIADTDPMLFTFWADVRDVGPECKKHWINVWVSHASCQQTRHVEWMLFYRWATVYDAGPKVKQHWFIVLYLLGYIPTLWQWPNAGSMPDTCL